VQHNEAMCSTGIAAQTIMLAAKSMRYDTCPLDDFEAVGEVINLPEDHAIAMFVVIGNSEQSAKPRQTQLEMNEVMSTNSF